MNPMTIVKSVVDLAVSAGAGAVVGNAIKQSTPANAKLVQKISIGVGGFVLSGLVGAQASKYATEQIDTTIEQIKAVKASFKKNN